MDWTLIPLWITSVAAAGGVIFSVTKNGKNQRKQDTELKTELKKDIESIKEKLDDPYDGLGAIKREVSSLKNYTA